jgi:hypothetical protein
MPPILNPSFCLHFVANWADPLLALLFKYITWHYFLVSKMDLSFALILIWTHMMLPEITVHPSLGDESKSLQCTAPRNCIDYLAGRRCFYIPSPHTSDIAPNKPSSQPPTRAEKLTATTVERLLLEEANPMSRVFQNIDSPVPTPLSARRVCPPPATKAGGSRGTH